jgi:hypothetical protein
MELTWFESYLIRALRVLKPFFRKHGFGLIEIEYGWRDGDYLVFRENSFHKPGEIKFIYNPGFDIIVSNKISLVELKNQYKDFSHLPAKYHGEEELEAILIGYTQFIEYLYFTK